MASISIDVSEVVKKLDPKTMEVYLANALKGGSALIQADIKQYPAPPSDSTYKRTGTLGKSWTRKLERGWASSGRMAIVIGSNVKYAPYVQHADAQAWMHKGRWQTAQQVAKDKTQEVARFIEQALIRWAS